MASAVRAPRPYDLWVIAEDEARAVADGGDVALEQGDEAIARFGEPQGIAARIRDRRARGLAQERVAQRARSVDGAELEAPQAVDGGPVLVGHGGELTQGRGEGVMRPGSARVGDEQASGAGALTPPPLQVPCQHRPELLGHRMGLAHRRPAAMARSEASARLRLAHRLDQLEDVLARVRGEALALDAHETRQRLASRARGGLPAALKERGRLRRLARDHVDGLPRPPVPLHARLGDGLPAEQSGGGGVIPIPGSHRETSALARLLTVFARTSHRSYIRPARLRNAYSG